MHMVDMGGQIKIYDVAKKMIHLKGFSIKEYSLADYISVPSKHVKRTFVNYGIDKNKIIHNPYGVDLSKFSKVESCSEKFIIIACGAVSLFRGAHYLIEAFYGLNMKNAELCFIGGIREEMLVFINKYKHKNIKFLGHKSQNELYKYYSQGSLLCITSMDEGLAMVIPQAMACGLAIFATDNTGADDMVKDGVEGKIIDSFSVDSIQKALLWAYNNQDEVSRMGLRAKNTVSSGFSWHDYSDRALDCYSKILQHER
jgi:glycosyltransferase involved in cell wall biosynthesis